MKKPGKNKKNTAKLGLLITAILWGSSLTVIKQASDTFNPNFILFVRFSLASIILAIIFRDRLKNPNRSDIKNGAVVGFLLFLAYSSQTLGVSYADPGRSAFLSASYCVIVPFLSWAVNRRKPDIYNRYAAILAVIGIYFISTSGIEGGTSIFEADSNMIIGDGLALMSGFLFAAHIIAVGKLTEGKDAIKMTIYQFVTAAICSGFATLILEDNSTMEIKSLRPVFELIYLAVFCTSIALLLQNIGQKYVSDSSAAIILAFEAVFGLIIPVFLGIETLTLASLTGFVLLFAAIIISETKLSFIKLGKNNKRLAA